ncbi:hypothetical protein D3C80_1393070 [compost metagenome]
MRVHILAIGQNFSDIRKRFDLSNDLGVFNVVIEVLTVIQLNVITKTRFYSSEVVCGEVDVLKRFVNR